MSGTASSKGATIVLHRSKAAGLAGALLLTVTSITGVFAASHREAPLISGDPTADNTDVYAFVSPNATNTLTIIANYMPNEEPAGGPNFYPFDDTVRYEIHVDNNGDGRGDVNYTFRFTKHTKATNAFGIPTYLYNDGPIDYVTDPTAGPHFGKTDPNWLVPQTYNVERNGVRIGTNLTTAPANIGPRSTPDYEAKLGSDAVETIGRGIKVFAGQRDDAFFVDTGSIFDLGGLRPFNAAYNPALPAAPTAPGVDDISGFNTNSIAIQIPIEQLTRNHALPVDANDPNAVVGVWAAASRQKTRVLAADGTVSNSGTWQQVSRLGNPLINEVVIPRVKKDYWNSQQPAGDSRFAKYYRAPELAALVNFLYPGLPDARTENRDDLVAIRDEHTRAATRLART